MQIKIIFKIFKKIKSPKKGAFWSKLETAGGPFLVKVYGDSERAEFFFRPLKAFERCQNTLFVYSVWVARASVTDLQSRFASS